MFHHLCTATYLIQLIISTETEVHFLADNFEKIDTLLVPTRYTFVLVLFLFLSVLLSPSVHWNLPWKLFSFKVGTTNIIKLIVKSIIIIINMGSSTLLKCLTEMRKMRQNAINYTHLLSWVSWITETLGLTTSLITVFFVRFYVLNIRNLAPYVISNVFSVIFDVLNYWNVTT